MPFVKYRLAGVERHLGNLHVALALAEEAVELARFAKDIVAERENLIESGLVNEGLGNYQTALAIFESLIEDNDDSVKNRSAAKAIYLKSGILEKLGNLPEAVEGYRQAIPLLKVMNLEELSINAQLAVIHISTKI
jgi:tetratricopeptide (TPR) repeat protein